MQHNPIILMREQLDNPVGNNKQSNIEEIEKEQERLSALHEGWLKHPITIQLINEIENITLVRKDSMCLCCIL